VPEGHSVHRIARQFDQHFVGRRVAVSSPQGRFASGAAMIDGHEMIESRAVGKQLFLAFDSGLWMRVHLGLYGAWDFAGEVTVDATLASASGRMGQTNQRGTFLEAYEDSLHSIGAPRRTRLRMAESEQLEEPETEWPPPPIGQVRARLMTEATVADLRGPTACEVIDDAGVARALAKLGPDPLVDRGTAGQRRFVENVRTRSAPIGQLLMDQSVVAGIGNVYRAELLFRAGLSPFLPGRQVPTDVAKALWDDWAKLLKRGVETGQMLTIDGLRGEAYRRALAFRADRHWVYHRTGEPCRRCGTPIAMEIMAGRKLYWCPTCQPG